MGPGQRVAALAILCLLAGGTGRPAPASPAPVPNAAPFAAPGIFAPHALVAAPAAPAPAVPGASEPLAAPARPVPSLAPRILAATAGEAPVHGPNDVRTTPPAGPAPTARVHRDSGRGDDGSIAAGSVATIVVPVPAPSGVDSADYRLRLNPGFRAFIPEAGRTGRMGDEFLVAVTFATPRGLAAGEVEAGTLTVEMTGHDPVVRDLTVRIQGHSRMEIVLDADEVMVEPDGTTELRYTLRNRGNVEDTVHILPPTRGPWTISTPAPVVVPTGEERRGAIVLIAPANARPGERELFVLTARSAEGDHTRVFHAVIVSQTGWLGGLAHVPSRLFIGHGLDAGAGPVVTLAGGGRVGPETDVRFELRHSDHGFTEPALQRQLGGPRARLEVQRPGLRAAVGDITGYRTTISSSLRQARGLRLEHAPGGLLSTRVVAAIPIELDGRLGDGHVVHAETGVRTSAGTFSLVAGDVVESARSDLPGYRSTGAGIRWEAVRGAHSGSVETTMIRLVGDDTLRQVGPAVEASYALRGQPFNGRVRYRSVPGAATSVGGSGNELSGSFAAQLRPGLSAFGWGHRTESNILARQIRTRSDAASLGLRGRGGPFQLQIGASWSERELSRNGQSATLGRQTIRADATFGRGAWSFQADGELGSAMELGQRGEYSSMAAGARFHSGPGWGWVRVQHTTRPGTLPPARTVQGGGAFDLGSVALSGGAAITDMSGTTTTSVWSAAEVRIQRDLSLHLGASARPAGNGNDWSFSIGASRRLSMPLPLNRQPDISGVVFDDANNNGRLDPGETVLEGVVVAVGHLQTRTDERGQFAFRDAPAVAPSVPTAGVPSGYMVSPATALRSRGHMEVALVRTATLELETFLDRNEDGKRDPGEEAGADVEITITDQEGRQRSATGDAAGRVRISGLMPGLYSVTARPPGDRVVDGRDPVVLMEVELAPGATVRTVVPVPVRSRTIRMSPGSGNLEFFR